MTKDAPPAETLSRWNLGHSLFALMDSQAKWSQETFGPDSERGPIGVLSHLQKEAQEVIDSERDGAFDIRELADCFLLLLDANRRAGFSFSQLLTAAVEKHEVCKLRKWDLPADLNAPIYHIDEPALPTAEVFLRGLGYAPEQIETLLHKAETHASQIGDTKKYGEPDKSEWKTLDPETQAVANRLLGNRQLDGYGHELPNPNDLEENRARLAAKTIAAHSGIPSDRPDREPVLTEFSTGTLLEKLAAPLTWEEIDGFLEEQLRLHPENRRAIETEQEKQRQLHLEPLPAGFKVWKPEEGDIIPPVFQCRRFDIYWRPGMPQTDTGKPLLGCQWIQWTKNELCVPMDYEIQRVDVTTYRSSAENPPLGACHTTKDAHGRELPGPTAVELAAIPEIDATQIDPVVFAQENKEHKTTLVRWRGPDPQVMRLIELQPAILQSLRESAKLLDSLTTYDSEVQKAIRDHLAELKALEQAITGG